MNAWLLLGGAIVCEVVATSALKASEGFTRLGPLALVVAGYGLAFWLLALTLRSIPVGVAYAIWSGLGTALIAVAGWWIYGQRLETAQIAGIALIIIGVLVMNLLPGSSAH